MRLFRDPPPEISHPAHPAHKLTLADAPPFECAACKEDGGGHGYSCEPCDFHLHKACALADRHAKLENPQLHSRALVLRDEPGPGTVCDACSHPVRGLHYSGKRLDFHPVCADLPDRVPVGDHLLQLRRTPKLLPWRCLMCPYADGDTRRHRRSFLPCCCTICERRSSFWWYRCYHAGKVVDLHLACFKGVSRLRWRTDHENRVGGGGQIVQAVAPILEGALQNTARNRPATELCRFCKIVVTMVKVVAALISGNPLGMIAAVADPAGELLQD